jgi:hypothetical protein
MLYHPGIQAFIFVLILIRLECSHKKQSYSRNADAVNIYEHHKTYVKGWKEMNKWKVMGLLQHNAVIQPNRLTPLLAKNI